VATVVISTVMYGIAVAVILSLIDQVRHAYRPRTRVLVKDSEARWCAVPATLDQLAVPGVVVYRFEANLFYSSKRFFASSALRKNLYMVSFSTLLASIISTTRQPKCCSK
jgi:sulfate permease, SulP family